MEVNDRILIKNTYYRKSTLSSFLKVCLYGCYTNPPFYRSSLFRQLNKVSRKIRREITVADAASDRGGQEIFLE